jgi:hypothetical protein
MYTSINIHIQNYIHAYTYTKLQYMYVYVCIKWFFISSFFPGTTRKSEDMRGRQFLKFNRKKVFKMMQNALFDFRSRTPVSTVKGDALCHCASMAVKPTSILTYITLLQIYTCIYAYTCIYVHIHYYMYIYMHIGLYMHIHAYKDIY